jgi:hypothetical protein
VQQIHSVWESVACFIATVKALDVHPGVDVPADQHSVNAVIAAAHHILLAGADFTRGAFRDTDLSRIILRTGQASLTRYALVIVFGRVDVHGDLSSFLAKHFVFRQGVGGVGIKRVRSDRTEQADKVAYEHYRLTTVCEAFSVHTYDSNTVLTWSNISEVPAVLDALIARSSYRDIVDE